MEESYNDKHAFICEWYEENANITRRYYIFYYPCDGTIELFDIGVRKTFLRRIKVEGITLDSFYIGSTLNVLGRIMKIVDFGCEDTKKKLANCIQSVFALIKPLDPQIIGEILTMIHNTGFKITKMKKVVLTREDLEILFAEDYMDPSFPFIVDYLTRDLVYGLELVGSNAIETWQKVMGHPDPTQAEGNTIRGRFGYDKIQNCVHGDKTIERSFKNLQYFFPEERAAHLPLTATLSNCTLCIVKPHALREGKLGEVMKEIDKGGFNITALTMYQIEPDNAEEFYEVYKGIVNEFKAMAEELVASPLVAMEIVAKNPSLYSAVEFRKLVGPSDPEVARLLRPHTLRAKFGVTKVRNAIHCSDLPEDGLLEVEYFFKILNM